MGKIICLTGLSGSGKSEIAQAMGKNSKIGVIRLGENVRKKYAFEKFDGTIEEYAEKYRFSSICEFIKDEIQTMLTTKDIVIIDSLRTIADYRFLLKMSTDIKLIMIVADRNKRLKWLKKRKRVGDPTSVFKLMSHDYWEINYGISNLIGIVDKFIVNNGRISDLQREVMEFVGKE